jgi:hypothetical protein
MAALLGATGLMDEIADLVILARSKPSYPAVVPILLPEDRIDMSFSVEGRNKVISMTWRARGKFPGAGEIQRMRLRSMSSVCTSMVRSRISIAATKLGSGGNTMMVVKRIPSNCGTN